MNGNIQGPLFPIDQQALLQQQQQQQLFRNGDDDNKYTKYNRVLEKTERESLWCWALWTTVFLGALTIGHFIAYFAAVDTFRVNATSSVSYSDGPAFDTVTPSVFNALQLRITGAINLALLGAFVTGLGFLGSLVPLLFWGARLEQIDQGASPWFYIGSAIWLPFAFLFWGAVSGVNNLYVLADIVLIICLVIFLWYSDDLLHSYAYIDSMNLVNGGGLTSASAWSWLFFAVGLFGHLYVILSAIIHMAFTYGNTTPVVTGFTSQLTTSLIAIPIAGYILSVGYPVIIGYWLGRTKSLATREKTVIIYNAFVLTVLAALQLFIFARQVSTEF